MNTNTTNELSNQAPGNPFAVQASAGSGALAAMTSNAAVTSVLASIWIAKQFPRNLAEVTLRMKQALLFFWSGTKKDFLLSGLQ